MHERMLDCELYVRANLIPELSCRDVLHARFQQLCVAQCDRSAVAGTPPLTRWRAVHPACSVTVIDQTRCLRAQPLSRALTRRSRTRMSRTWSLAKRTQSY